MENILNFQQYSNNLETNIPSILYNKEYNCINIGEHYIFIDQKITLKEGEKPLNEGFLGFEWEDFIPNSTSQWVHLGVDAASGILDAIPSGVTQIISLVIDILHAGSYFIEANYGSPDEKLGLQIAGVITAIFAFIPGVGNVGGAATKKVLRGIGKSAIGRGAKGATNLVSNTLVFRLIKGLLKIPGLPIKGVKKVFQYMFNVPALKVRMFKAISKAEDSWLASQLLKVPFVKKVVGFIKKDIDKVLLKTQKAFGKEFKHFQKALKDTTKANIKKSYSNLSKETKILIDEDTFVNQAMALLNKEGYFGKKFLVNNIDVFESKILKITNFKVDAILKQTNLVNKKVDEFLINLGSKEAYGKASKAILGKEFKKRVSKHISKNGLDSVNDIPFEKIYKSLLLDASKGSIKNVAKRAIPVATKNLATSDRDDKDVDKEDVDKEKMSFDTDSQDSEEVKSDSDIEKKDNEEPDTEQKQYSESITSLKDKYKLTTSVVATTEQVGTMDVVFEAPNKKGEDGKVLIEGGVFEEQDLANGMELFEDDEKLLNVLKLIGKKNKNKDRVRRGEMKKWEKTKKLSTPFIESKGYHVEFYFVIRERSFISFATKRDDTSVNWSILLNSNAVNERYYKVNNSLYLILNAVEEKEV